MIPSIKSRCMSQFWSAASGASGRVSQRHDVDSVWSVPDTARDVERIGSRLQRLPAVRRRFSRLSHAAVSRTSPQPTRAGVRCRPRTARTPVRLSTASAGTLIGVRT